MIGVARFGQSEKKLILRAAQTLFSYLLSVLLLMYVSRTLQPAGMGTVTFAASVVSYFALFAGIGIDSYGFRRCAASRGDVRDLALVVKELVLLGLLFAALSYVLLTGTVCLVPQFRVQKALYLFLGLGMFFSALRCDWFFMGTEEWKYLTLSALGTQLAAAVLTVVLVKDSGDWLLYGALTLTAPLLMAICSGLLLRRRFSGAGKMNVRARPLRHLKASVRFFLMSCMVTIYGQMDIVMLGLMEDKSVIGYYGVAAKLKAALTAAGGIIWNVNLPQAVKYSEEKNKDGLQQLTVRGMRMVLFLQIPVFFYALRYAKELVEFLSGAAYAPAVQPFEILLFTVLPIAVSNILGGQVLIPAGQEKKLLASEIAGTVVNLVLNAILIPRFSMYGAAVATVAAEVIVCAMTIFYVKREVGICIFSGRFVLKTVLLSAASLCVSVLFCTLLSQAADMNAFVTLVVSAGSFALSYFGLRYLYRKMNPLALCRCLLSWITTRPKDRVFACPCCGKHWKSFVDGGFAQNPALYNTERYRDTPQKVVCPFCGSLPRHRIIAAWAENHISQLQRSKILCFAPESSMMRWFNRHHVAVTTADLFAKADLRLDITQIDLPDETYDMVFCNHVLEHVGDYRKALFEVRRILRTGGMLVISFPIDPTFTSVFERPAVTEQERIALFGQHDHLRVFGANSARMLEESGFAVEEMDIAGMPQNILPIIGPADYDSNRIFCCVKI